jgi:hypothetical protein
MVFGKGNTSRALPLYICSSYIDIAMLFPRSDQIYGCIYGLFTCHIHRSNLARQRILRFHAKNILFYILHKYCVCFEHSKE